MGLRALIFRTRVERELDEELREYLNAAIDQKIASGMTREDATRAARTDMGSVAAIKDNVRDVAWETRIEAFAPRPFAVDAGVSEPQRDLATSVAVGADARDHVTADGTTAQRAAEGIDPDIALEMLFDNGSGADDRGVEGDEHARECRDRGDPSRKSSRMAGWPRSGRRPREGGR